MRSRVSAPLLALLALAVLAAPVARLQAMSPCAAGEPMACCQEPGDDGAPPCGCAMSPVPPAPAVLEAAPDHDVVLAESLAPATVPEVAGSPVGPPEVVPRSRTVPLFLLFSTLLN